MPTVEWLNQGIIRKYPMPTVRPPAVAGAFYPDDADQLGAVVRNFIAAPPSDIGTQSPSHDAVPKAIVAPHAGYIYSGGCAGRAYSRLIPRAKTITRVVLLGPCHRVAVNGLATSSAAAFSTPLGEVPLDRDAIARILRLDQVQIFDATHADEHSIEVHLPFLQVLLDDFSLIPLVVGDASDQGVAEVIEILWGGDETLIVVSTDLSHFLDYDSARKMDAVTCKAVEDLTPENINREQACGRVPLRGLLTVAKRLGLNVETIELSNSGDTAGSRDRVVGYGAWGFSQND